MIVVLYFSWHFLITHNLSNRNVNSCWNFTTLYDNILVNFKQAQTFIRLMIYFHKASIEALFSSIADFLICKEFDQNTCNHIVNAKTIFAMNALNWYNCKSAIKGENIFISSKYKVRMLDTENLHWYYISLYMNMLRRLNKLFQNWAASFNFFIKRRNCCLIVVKKSHNIWR